MGPARWVSGSAALATLLHSSAVSIYPYCWLCSSQLDLHPRPRHFNLRVASKEFPRACGDSGAATDSTAQAAATVQSITMCQEENTLLRSLSPKWSLQCWLSGNTFSSKTLGRNRWRTPNVMPTRHLYCFIFREELHFNHSKHTGNRISGYILRGI